MRLDIFIEQTYDIELSKARELIWDGKVIVNGIIINDVRWVVILGCELELVRCNGFSLLSAKPLFHRLLLMNKPVDCVSIRFRGSASWCKARGVSTPPTDDATQAHRAARKRGTKCVYDYVPPVLRHPSLGVFGRLDKNTTGLLLMGTDGSLQNLLMHPSSGCKKTYIASLQVRASARLRRTAVQEFSQGVRLENGTQCRPSKLEILKLVASPSNRAEGDAPKADEDTPFPSVVRVTVQEGQYHQVKRMIAACGGRVRTLERIRVGGLSLEDFPLLRERGTVIEAGPRELAIIQGMLPAVRVVSQMPASQTLSPASALRERMGAIAPVATGVPASRQSGTRGDASSNKATRGTVASIHQRLSN